MSQLATGTLSESGAAVSSLKKSEREAVEEQTGAFSSVFIGVANQLLSLYLLDSTKVQLLLQMVRRTQLEQYELLRKKKEFGALLVLLRDIYLKHTDAAVLEEAAATLAFVCRNDHPLRDEAQTAATELASKLAAAFNGLYERVHGSQVDMEGDAADSLASLQHALRRLLCVSRALSPPELAWDALPSLDKTLQFYAMNHAHQDEQDILVALLELAFSALQANVTRLQKDSEHAAGEEEEEGKEEEEEEKESSSKKKKKKSKRKSGGVSAAAAAAAASASAAFASLLSSTHRLQSTFLSQLDLVFSFSGGPSAPVRDAAFAILADSFILFSGKFAASPLHSLVIGHDDPAKLQSLQAAFNAHFDAIMDVPQRFRKGDSREADIADKKFEAFRLATKVR